MNHKRLGIRHFLLILTGVAFAILGGMIGGATGLQQSISEVSPDNRRFDAIAGLFFGLPSAFIGYGIVWALAKSEWLAAVTSLAAAIIVSMIFNYILTVALAAG